MDTHPISSHEVVYLLVVVVVVVAAFYRMSRLIRHSIMIDILFQTGPSNFSPKGIFLD